MSLRETEPDPPESSVAKRLAEKALSDGLVDPAELERPSLPTFGRYRAEKLLGVGATAEVFLAHDPDMDRRVAVKVLTPGASTPRFQREAKILASLAHPNLLQIYDVGAVGGRPYFVVEFVEGPTLEDAKLDRRGFLEVVAQVALGCHAAHEQGVVHRDLKPANVILGDRPVVADFGVAKAENRTHATQEGVIVGTPVYMAPEQIGASREVDRRTDVYALGVILYEGLTGKLPFDGKTLIEVVARISSGEAVAPRDLDPTIPEALEDVVLRAMAAEPQDRYPTAQALAGALRALLNQPMGPPPPTQGSDRTVLVAGAIACGAAVLVFGLGLVATRGPSEERPGDPQLTRGSEPTDPDAPAPEPVTPESPAPEPETPRPETPAPEPEAPALEPEPPAPKPPVSTPTTLEPPEPAPAAVKSLELLAELDAWAAEPAVLDKPLPVRSVQAVLADPASSPLVRATALDLLGDPQAALAEARLAVPTPRAQFLVARLAWEEAGWERLAGSGSLSARLLEDAKEVSDAVVVTDDPAFASFVRLMTGGARSPTQDPQAAEVSARAALFERRTEEARTLVKPALRRRGTCMGALITRMASRILDAHMERRWRPGVASSTVDLLMSALRIAPHQPRTQRLVIAFSRTLATVAVKLDSGAAANWSRVRSILARGGLGEGATSLGRRALASAKACQGVFMFQRRRLQEDLRASELGALKAAARLIEGNLSQAQDSAEDWITLAHIQRALQLGGDVKAPSKLVEALEASGRLAPDHKALRSLRRALERDR